MNKKLAIILLLLVLVPLGLMIWLGIRVAQGELATVKESIRSLHIDKLKTIEGGIQKVIQRRKRGIVTLAESLKTDPASLRAAVRTNPALSQIFVLSKKGKLLHPSVEGKLSGPEEEFLTRASQVWKDQAIFFRPSAETKSPQGADSGWYSWYWGSGVHFIFWLRTGDGTVIGFELDRYRLIADIIAELPDSQLGGSETPTGMLALQDSKGEALYQWGDYQPEAHQQPLVGISLGAPLSPWRLAYFQSGSDAELGSSVLFNLVAALLVFAIALGVMAVYFYRESSRELRDASQRVSFVNHVSHELKTPLTNIRMYAELLQESLDQTDEKTTRHLDVVVSESVRLSRLINNVLTFGRQQRKSLKLRMNEGVVDRIVAAVIESFRPSLKARGVDIEFQAGAPGRVQVDPDALGQIVGNLLGNVEKYAPDSGSVQVMSRQDKDTTTITVSDNGPGIPRAERENIFKPFVRLSSRVTDGVAGTGIGLSIARELARLHGGDLELLSSGPGAVFRVTIHAGRSG